MGGRRPLGGIEWAGSEEAKPFLDEQMRDMDTVLLGRGVTRAEPSS